MTPGWELDPGLGLMIPEIEIRGKVDIDLERIISDLESSDPDVRADAAEILKDFCELETIGRPSHGIDGILAKPIILTDPRLMKIVDKALRNRDEDHRVRAFLIDFLCYLDDLLGHFADPQDRKDIANLIRPCLADPNEDVRENAATAAGHFGDTEATDFLIPLLCDKDWRIEMHAREALLKIGIVSRQSREIVIKALRKALEDPNYVHIRTELENIISTIENGGGYSPSGGGVTGM